MLGTAGWLFALPTLHHDRQQETVRSFALPAAASPTARASTVAPRASPARPAGGARAATSTRAPAAAAFAGSRCNHPVYQLLIPSQRVDTCVEAGNLTATSWPVPTGPYAAYKATFVANAHVPGVSIFLAHTELNGYGVFNHLGSLAPGAALTLVRADGTVHRYRFLGMSDPIEKSKPYGFANAVLHPLPGTALVAGTCFGPIDHSRASHTENIIGYFAAA